ncbi:MAG: nucleoside deaminase [Candidatus Gracilibacteria bacterium]|nr:nucleoside deaminase [Candidatus Gracilibacteria bacterium]
MNTEEKYMLKSIEIAKSGFKAGEYPIGAVIVKNDKIIAVGEVRRKRDEDPTAHAEIVAIRNACNKLNSRSLEGCIIYSTQECCPMCTSAIIWAKMDGIIFGAFSSDTKGKETNNYSWRQIDISCKELLSKSLPKIELIEGFLREKCKELLDFDSN